MLTLPKIKICGITTPETYACCVKEGVDFIGIMQHPASPRYIPAPVAANILKACDDEHTHRPAIVAVCVDANDAQLEYIMQTIKPDLWQCHGQETPDRISAIKQKWGRPVIKAISISCADDLLKTQQFTTADYWLFDAKPPSNNSLGGGNALRFDWTILQQADWKDLPERPWFLAGGLQLDNIYTALTTTQAPMIDLSSGVESARGVKSSAKITTFMRTLRHMASSHA